MTEQNIAKTCCSCKEEVAFKLYSEIQKITGTDEPSKAAMLVRPSYNKTKDLQEYHLKLFSHILSVVKGEIDQKDIKLPECVW